MAKKETVDERTEQILAQLLRDGTLSAEEIAIQLGTSIATVRRDLQRLELQGRLKRTHGGAVPVQPLLYQSFRHDSSFQEQLSRHAEEKQRIGAAAAELIEDGDFVGITPGTTTMQFTRSIPARKGITLVTNTVNIAMELSQRRDVDVLVLGGLLRGDWFSLGGPVAADAVRHLVINKMLIGVKGIDPHWGLTAGNADEAAINRLMIERARTKIVIADHSKLGASDNYEFWPANKIDVLITDTKAPEKLVALFRKMNVKVMIV